MVKLAQTTRLIALISILGISAGMAGCASIPGDTPEEKRAYFETLEKETLARLVKEQPATAEELAQSVGYAIIKQKILKVPVFGAANGIGVIVEKDSGTRTYVRVPELQFGAGWGGRAQQVVLIFRDLEKLKDLANGKWHAGISAEVAAKAGDAGAAGSAGSTDVRDKGFSTYALTDTGVSATITLNVLRVQPISLD